MARGKAEMQLSVPFVAVDRPPLTRGSNQIGRLRLWRLLQMPMSVDSNRGMPASMVHGIGQCKVVLFFPWLIRWTFLP